MSAMTRDLLLFPIGSTLFGVWEKDISSVSPARTLHRLPLSPPAIAGMTVIEDRGVTVFDLGACFGAAALPPEERTRFLLVREGDRTIGFAVAGKIETHACSDEQVIALPEAVRTPVIGTCTVRNRTVIPLISIRTLHERLQQGMLDMPPPKDAGPVDVRPTVPGGALRFLSFGSDLFCVPGEGTSVLKATDTPMSILTYARPPVTGVLFHDGAIIPVLELAARLGSEDGGTGSDILITNSDGRRYAIPIAADRGLSEAGEIKLSPLPPLVTNAWMHEAIVRHGTIVPVVDLAILMTAPERGNATPYREKAYVTDSGFSARFQRESVEVIEFSLLGSLHALPKDEVKEAVPPMPFRTIPGLPEIVLGVAERGGKLLPVLDLAAIFGRRTAAGGQARMLRIENGDFHALVLVEGIDGERILTPELQRTVPIALPHDVLYGCYLDERAVRLIMNVHALAVHFERTEVRDLVASLAPPVTAQPLLGEQQAERPSAEAPREAPKDGDPVAPGATRYDRSRAAAMMAARQREQEELKRQQAASVVARKKAQKREDEPLRPLALERAKEAEEVRLREEATARARAKTEAAAREAEERRRADEIRARAEAEATAKAEAEAKERSAAKERAAAEEKERKAREREREQQEQQRKQAAAREKARKREEDARRAEEARRAARQTQREQADRERQRAEEGSRQVEVEEVGAQASRVPAAGDPRSSAAPQRPARSRKALSIAAAVAAVLVLLLYWIGSPSRIGRDGAEHAPVRRQAVPPQEPEAPLILDIPPSMPQQDIVVYVVVKGDTLWDISERFTGNPFNYPRVAKDNSIATPDLIFPGQRIRLIQQ